MIDARVRGEAPLLWIGLLTVASLLTTLVFACATPFPSLAALAAVHMKRRDGAALVIAAWVVSQTVGFCFMGYPWDGATLLSGVAVGTAALAALFAAGFANGRSEVANRLVRLAAAFFFGFVAFKLTIALWSPLLAHPGPALSMPVIARQFVRYAAVLVGLEALFRLSLAAGVPAPMRFEARRSVA